MTDSHTGSSEVILQTSFLLFNPDTHYAALLNLIQEAIEEQNHRPKSFLKALEHRLRDNLDKYFQLLLNDFKLHIEGNNLNNQKKLFTQSDFSEKYPIHVSKYIVN